MLNFGLNKSDIENINARTYNIETGLFILPRFDSELISIFKKEDIDFLAYDKDTIYLKLELASEYLGKKITQGVIKETKKDFKCNSHVVENIFITILRDLGSLN
jgi:hypothetical protein